MLRRLIVVMGAVAAFALMFASTNASAAGHAGRSFHSPALGSPSFARHTFRHHRGARRAAPNRPYWYWPYGGFVGEYPPSYYTPGYNYFDPIGAFTMLQRLDPIIPPPPPLTCHHSVETRTVPAEAGGTVQITITRC